MPEYFVRQSITISAPAQVVWRVLTERELTSNWVREFSGSSGELVSDWKSGSPVLWRTAEGKVFVEGNVTAIEPFKLLRYTVFDTSGQRPPVGEKDGITFTLSEQGGQTRLSVTQGDFGKMPDGEKYYKMSVPVWERVLPTIKAVAERAKAAA
ncbi:MAG TPA: SRPBCC domain-containing protein [Aggregatilineales bacterium]|nr:SRPBCC domain-containing protein [Aggregatilineales bacterium]